MTERVIIGSKYEGPVLDRPSLRRLPSGWQLELDDEQPPAFEFLLKAVMVLGGVWLFWTIIFSLEHVR